MKVVGTVINIGLVLVIVVLGGQLIWNNLRPDDPLLPEWEPYTQERFDALSATGAPVVVEVYASWCPTCIAQHAAFKELWARKTYDAIHFMRVDYDADSAFVNAQGIRGTGTLLLYRKGLEIRRANGLIAADDIETFLDRIIKEESL